MKRSQHSALIRKRRKVIAIVAGAAVVLGFLGYYATGTPAWSLFQLYRAYRSHDIRGALKYIDVKAVLESTAERLRTELGGSAAVAGSGGAGSESADKFIEALKPLLQERIRDRVLGAVVGTEYESAVTALTDLETGGEDLGGQVAGRLFSIKRDGGAAELRLRNGIRVGLRQTRDRYWRIVSIEGLIRLTPEEKELLKSTVQQGELRERILDRIQF